MSLSFEEEPCEPLEEPTGTELLTGSRGGRLLFGSIVGAS